MRFDALLCREEIPNPFPTLRVSMATPIFTLQQTAGRIGVHHLTIVRWLNENRIPGVQKKKNTRGQYVFTDEDVKKFKEYKNSIKTVL